ncbi:MAG TPA: glycosyltransferase family 9 protein [Terriglobia bacterium]|nr:glycosyltransferase family 9 protein [Terriglobia bacterium]
MSALGGQTGGVESRSPRIAVVRAGAIGDTLMATPLVRAIRGTYPNAYLAFLCARGACDVVRYSPHIDEVIPLAARHLPAWLSPEKSRIVRRLNELRLHALVMLESHPSLTELARRSGAARIVSYGGLPGVKGAELAIFDPRKHGVENNLHAAELLGVRPYGLHMEMHYPEEFDDRIRERLRLAGIARDAPIVGIHPGWGGRKHSLEQTRLKSWPPDRFARIARGLVADRKAHVVLTGAAVDRPLTEFIARQSGVACLNLAGELSLLELAALIRRLDVYVSVDSGPAHMAAALGTPLVVLWGPAILEQTRPIPSNPGALRIVREPVPCAPCYGTPLMKTCQDNICMKGIGAERVEALVRELLA